MEPEAPSNTSFFITMLRLPVQGHRKQQDRTAVNQHGPERHHVQESGFRNP